MSFGSIKEDLTNQAMTLKRHHPFMIVWFAIHPETLDSVLFATPTRHKLNALVRKGYLGFVI